MEGNRYHAIEDHYGGLTLLDIQTSKTIYLQPGSDASTFIKTWDDIILFWSHPHAKILSPNFSSPSAHFDFFTSSYFQD